MPIFVRRKLQLMLDELAPHIAGGKFKDLMKRIEHENPDQALPAEYELALAWGVSKVAQVEIERKFGSRAPDIYSPDLLPSAPAAIEVAALSDESLGGKAAMKRAANIINASARKFAKDATDHLHYEFLEESGTLPADQRSWPFRRFYRRRRITSHFAMPEGLEPALADWLKQRPPSEPLRWEDDKVGVIISWRDHVHTLGNTFSSMPAVSYDIRKNPLYETLKAKAKQLNGVPSGILKGIIVGDAGCSLIRDIRRISRGIHEVTGEQVIREFVDRHDVDFVVAFAPRHVDEHGLHSFRKGRVWQVLVTPKGMSKEQFSKIQELAALLPAPYLHGYQARSWHEQRMFDPQGRGHYLPAHYTSGKGKSQMKVSARGLQEFLAGRISLQELKRWSLGDHNFFEATLARGKTISGVRFESSGTDGDDDYVVFEFEEDPAASPLRSPQGQD